MKEQSFLNKLRKSGKLELIEPTEHISESYEIKSRDYLLSAKILFKENLFEPAIGEAYYSIYNVVQSLFFKCGIKCENHGAAVVLLKRVFQLNDLYKIFLEAKEERIDKQYYVETTQNNPVTKESTQNLINIAEKFILEIKNYKRNLKLTEIDDLRKRFKDL